METIIQSVGDLFTAAIGWVAQTGSTVVSNPILLMFNALPIVGLGVGLFNRLKSN